jgi:hypothetical protein
MYRLPLLSLHHRNRTSGSKFNMLHRYKLFQFLLYPYRETYFVFDF